MYLLDTNIYIDFYDRYYPIRHFSSFWKQFTPILNDKVMIPDVVAKENNQNSWFTDEFLSQNYNKELIDHRLYQNEWAHVLNHISESPYYSDKALLGSRAWTNENIADGWLIAIAMKENYTIVSDELPNPNLNTLNASSNPKVPDIAKDFNISCIDMLSFFDEIELSV